MSGFRGPRGMLMLVAAIALVLATSLQIFSTARSKDAASQGDGLTPRVAGPSGPQAAAPSAGAVAPFETGMAVKHDLSQPLRTIKPIPPEPFTTIREMPEFDKPAQDAARAPVKDPVVQRNFGLSISAMPAPSANFNGIGNRNGVYPPDTNGDVGPNHYVQFINLSFQIFSKSGTSLYGPANGNTLWSGFGAPCETRNDGDPIALYDPIADRWLMSQFTAANPYGECVAISQTADPTGAWYRYFFQFSTSVFYDYPHLGVWPDGYYMSANRFGGIFQSFQGASAIVLNRSAMLQGLAAGYQSFNLSTSYGTLLPSDLDGATAPPAGSPNFFGEIGSNALHLWRFHTDWATPANSTFTGPTTLAVAAYNQLCSGTRSCVPQPGTNVGLDGLGDRLMHRLAYRNFGDHEALVLNHSVNVGGGQAGVRWYEVRSPNGTPSIYQQGTYAPDSTNRWMGSVAMDQSGNMALGFSVSSGTVYPSIRYTGRLASDPLGTLPQGEATLVNGAGVQTGSASRWGDYAMMSVDPTDDCTFWFTTEYMPTTGTAPWQTRIGAFKFPSCGGVAPTPTATSSVPTSTPTSTATPLPANTPTSTPTATDTPNPTAPSFSLSVTPLSQTVTRGNSTTYTVQLASLNNFAGSVNLTVTGLPNKATGTFNPNPVTLAAGGTGSSVLTVSTARGTGQATYTLTITGTGSPGGVVKTQQVTLTVTR